MPQAYPKSNLVFVMVSIVAITVNAIISHSILPAYAADETYDVVVAGAGTGGVGAAIQAARMGAKVLLLEETDYIGGQMSAAGVTTIDLINSYWGTGIYKEYDDKQKAIYGISGRSEPSQARDTLMSMIAAERNITLSLRSKISSIQKSGSQITGVTLLNGKTIAAKNIIDATEYGDILPLAGANYRAGNSTNSSPNPNACIQDITYTAVIKAYTGGPPEELLIKSPPPGYNESIRQHFASIVSTDTYYDQNNIAKFDGHYPVNWHIHTAYRYMPLKDGSDELLVKTGVNWANDYPNVNSTLSSRYLTDQNYRKQINCEAKLRTIQFMYYMQKDLGMRHWAVANDEGYDTIWNREQNNCLNIPAELKAIERNMPPIPYVRESMRVIGLKTLLAKETRRTSSNTYSAELFPTSIAIGEYHNDLHNCNTDTQLETNLGETRADFSAEDGPFQIPLETLISNNIDGLIAAEKNISVSRFVAGSIRMQPVTMLTGQAAGALATLSAKTNRKPRDIPAPEVQEALLAQKSILYPFFDVNPSTSFFAPINLSALQGYVAGSGDFKYNPSGLITRDRAAVILLRIKYGPKYVAPAITSSRFPDVPISHWAAAWINKLAQDGITSGCGNNNYCPTATISRAEMAVMLLKAKLGSSYTPPPATGIFTDVPITHFAAAYIEDFKKYEFTNGCSSSPLKFCPDAKVNMGEMAAFIVNSQKIGISSPPPTPTRTPTIVPTPFVNPYDLNGDNIVNYQDFEAFKPNYGKTGTNGFIKSDMDKNGKVDIFDYNLLVTNFNK